MLTSPLTVTLVTCNDCYMISTRKQELVEASLDYLIENGVAGLSLRPLADAIGTSARLLIFHFGSKEALLAEVLGALQVRLQAGLVEMASASAHAQKGSSLFERFWRWATVPANLRLLRLGLEVQILALQDPQMFSKKVRESSTAWMDLILHSLPEQARTPATATLFTALFDGLVLDLLATGDRKRTTDTVIRFVDLMRGSIQQTTFGTPISPRQRKHTKFKRPRRFS